MARPCFVSVVLLLLCGLVLAFSSVGSPFAASGDSNRHETITREGVDGLGFSEDLIACLIGGNYDTDWSELNWDPVRGITTTAKYDPAHHFDRPTADPDGSNFSANEDAFIAGYGYICGTVRADVLFQLRECNQDYKQYCTVMGSALHALQDFFAHSNFIDLPAADQDYLMNLLTSCSEPSSTLKASGKLPKGLKLAYFGSQPDSYTHEENAHDDEGFGGFAEARGAATRATRKWFNIFREKLYAEDLAFKWFNFMEYDKPWFGEYVPKYTKENYKDTAKFLSLPDGVIKEGVREGFMFVRASSPDAAELLKTERLNVVIRLDGNRDITVGLDFGRDSLVYEDFAPAKEPTLQVRTTKYLIEQIAKSADKKRTFAKLFKEGLLRVEGVGGFLNDAKAAVVNGFITSWLDEKDADKPPALPPAAKYDLATATRTTINSQPAWKVSRDVIVFANPAGNIYGCTNSRISSYVPAPRTVYTPTAGIYRLPPISYTRVSYAYPQLRTAKPVFAQIGRVSVPMPLALGYNRGSSLGRVSTLPSFSTISAGR